MLTDAEIADLRALLRMASPGPWTDGVRIQLILAADMHNSDATLLVAAANALPALLDDLEVTKRGWLEDNEALQEVTAERDAARADRTGWMDRAVERQEALDAALAQVAAIREALQDLFDEQNGPPLYLDRENWQAAYDKAAALLADPAPDAATRGEEVS